MKRQIVNEGVEGLDIRDYLMMLSQARDTNPSKSLSREEVFECKTCNRKFTSFQALGGHRASHKRPKLDDGEEVKAVQTESLGLGMGNRPKMRKCSICGQGFSLGQALGGHMRKHRDAINEGLSSINQQVVAEVPVLKRPSSIFFSFL